MTSIALVLLFAGAAILSLGSMTASWIRVRGKVAANLAALGTVEPERAFFVAISPLLLDPVPGVRAVRRRRARQIAAIRPPRAARAAA